MSGRKVIVIVLCVVIVTLAHFAALNGRRNAATVSLQPFGRYTAPQMIDRATPIMRALLPQQNDLLLTAEPCTAPNTDSNDGRDIPRYWNLDCTSEQGNLLARVVYDADTGDIRNVERNGLMVDVPAAKVTCCAPHPISAQEATHKAQEWLRTLGFAARWRIEAVTQHGGSAWDIRLSAENAIADLVIDATTGTLLFAGIDPRR